MNPKITRTREALQRHAETALPGVIYVGTAASEEDMTEEFVVNYADGTRVSVIVCEGG